jgi:hypothetical protein
LKASRREERTDKKLKVKVLKRKRGLGIFFVSSTTAMSSMMLEEEENSVLNLSIMTLKCNTVAMFLNVNL